MKMISGPVRSHSLEVGLVTLPSHEARSDIKLLPQGLTEVWRQGGLLEPQTALES